MDRLDALTAFVAIADEGGFAAAARHMGVSPQAVTRAIAGLEARLGTQLLLRTTRSVRLTDEGATFLARCRQVLHDLGDAEQAVTGGGGAPHGTLRVTAPIVFGRLHVLPVVAELLRRHPALSVRLLLIDRPVQLVEEGIDVAVRIGERVDSALRAVTVGSVRRVLVASPAYLAERGVPATPSALPRHALIAFTGLGSGGSWRFGPEARAQVAIEPRLVVNGADAAIAAAEAGLGITRVLSYQAQASVAAGRLVTVLDAEAPLPMPVSLLFQAARSGSHNVRTFVQTAKQLIRPLDLGAGTPHDRPADNEESS